MSDDHNDHTAAILTGAQALVRSLEEVGVDGRIRHPRRRDPAGVRPAVRLHESPAHPRPPRAGRRTRGRGLRAGDRQGRGVHRHLRPGRDQPGHADRRCLHGLGADRRDHRPGAASAIGTDAFQEADISGITMPITKHSFLVQRPEDIAQRDRRGVPPRLDRPARARCWSTSPRTCCRPARRSTGRRRSTCPVTTRSAVRTASRSAKRPS